MVEKKRIAAKTPVQKRDDVPNKHIEVKIEWPFVVSLLPRDKLIYITVTRRMDKSNFLACIVNRTAFHKEKRDAGESEGPRRVSGHGDQLTPKMMENVSMSGFVEALTEAGWRLGIGEQDVVGDKKKMWIGFIHKDSDAYHPPRESFAPKIPEIIKYLQEEVFSGSRRMHLVIHENPTKLEGEEEWDPNFSQIAISIFGEHNGGRGGLTFSFEPGETLPGRMIFDHNGLDSA